MRKPYPFLLVWFSCSVSASRLRGNYDSVEVVNLGLSGTALTFAPLPVRELSRLTISSPSVPSRNALEETDLVRIRRLAKGYSLRELDNALKVLINTKGTTVDEASTVLLSSPLFHKLTERILDEAINSGYFSFLRCLQNKMLRTLPSMPCEDGPTSLIQIDNPFEKLDKKILHKLLAYSYKRSWGDLSFWNDHIHKMDWVKFWEVVFEVDNVELFKDLVTQRLSLPFNRLVNLRKSKLSDLVKKYKAEKIGAYLGIPNCKEAIIFDDDGQLDINLFKFDQTGKPLFNMGTVISVAVQSNNIDFLKKFKSIYPKHFSCNTVIFEALKQARFNIFYWVHSENPEELKKYPYIVQYGIMESDHLEERREFLSWILKQFPGWTPLMGTNPLCPEILEDLFKLNPDACPKKPASGYCPSYGILKWTWKNKPEWFPFNHYALDTIKRSGDMDFFETIYKMYKWVKGTTQVADGVDIWAFEMGSMSGIRDYILPYRGPTQKELLAAAKNGHVNILKLLAEKEHKIDFTDKNTLIDIANSGHIHVMKYIHESYPEIFTSPFDISGILGHDDGDDDRKLKMLKCLYELFTPKNILFSLDHLTFSIHKRTAPVLHWILEKYPEIFKDELMRDNKKAHEKIKEMIKIYATTCRHHPEGLELLMNRVQSNLEWNSNDLDSIAHHGSFYFLDMIYNVHEENESLWNPLKHAEELAYLQWYYFKVTKNLPWKDLALYAAGKEGHIPLLYWISIKNPAVLRSLNQKHLECSDHHDAHKYGGCYATLDWLTKKSETIYYTQNNPALDEDEVSMYYKERELWSR